MYRPTLKTITMVATLASLLLSSVGFATAQDAMADRIVGIWETEDGNLKFEMFEAGETYSARILHGARLLADDGKTYKQDTQNPDPALRERSLERLIFITGLAWDDIDRRWEGGRLYQADSGRTLSARVTLEQDTMNLRAYRGRPLIGRTIALRRITH